MALLASLSNHTAQGQWAQAIAAPALEFAATPLAILTGAIPPGIRGTLYRNGPARLERNGVRVGHWFDGDGAVLRVAFGGEIAVATYRYVRSAGYVAEAEADQFLYRGYGSLTPGSIWQRCQAQVKNAANTSVLALPDRVLALWEGGLPHRLDPITLATEGLDALESLTPRDTFSAHPKRHARTGQIFNFGVVAGGNATLRLYRCSSTGVVEKQASVALTGIPLVHDFVLADRYLVFCIPPLRLDALPAVFGLQSFSEALRWQPQRGTQLIVVDADSFEVMAWNQVEPWFQWHFGQGFLDPTGHVVFDVVRYADFATNQQLKEVASGVVSTPAEAQLWRYHIDPQTAKIVDQQCLVDRHCEFPVVFNGSGTDPVQGVTYLNIHSSQPAPVAELFGAIGRYDPQTQSLGIADAGAGCYPSEPIPVPDTFMPQQPWVLTVVYNSHHHRSELWIYDGDNLEHDPVCRLSLPQVIPPGFHGTWTTDSVLSP
ncbi:MAG: carotenoid oxygenase family protein [Nodosilinea sp.]